MRILAGELKGRNVGLPPGSPARPATGAVREQLMSLLGANAPDGLLTRGAFLDLFAASGVTGFEALSRGAQLALFVEVDARHVASIKRTSWAFGVQEQCRVLKVDARRCAAAVAKASGGTPLAAVFADPPFMPGFAAQFMPALGKLTALALPEARFVVRSIDKLPAAVAGLELLESRSGGKGKLCVYGLAAPPRDPDGA